MIRAGISLVPMPASCSHFLDLRTGTGRIQEDENWVQGSIAHYELGRFRSDEYLHIWTNLMVPNRSRHGWKNGGDGGPVEPRLFSFAEYSDTALPSLPSPVGRAGGTGQALQKVRVNGTQ